MELIKPDLGLLFWMILSFSVVLLVLVRFAWRPILKALRDRERAIGKSLLAAKRAREEMAKIEFGNEKITALAKIERDNLLKEAKDIKDKIIEEAKEEAKKEAKKIIDNALQSVQKEKNEAINEIKNEIASLSVNIAEKLLKQKLVDEANQKKLLDNLIDNIDFN